MSCRVATILVMTRRVALCRVVTRQFRRDTPFAVPFGEVGNHFGGFQTATFFLDGGSGVAAGKIAKNPSAESASHATARKTRRVVHSLSAATSVTRAKIAKLRVPFACDDSEGAGHGDHILKHSLDFLVNESARTRSDDGVGAPSSGDEWQFRQRMEHDRLHQKRTSSSTELGLTDKRSDFSLQIPAHRITLTGETLRDPKKFSARRGKLDTEGAE
jgi:hypothetical protein